GPGEGILLIRSDDTSFSSMGGQGGSGILVNLQHNKGTLSNTFFIFCLGDGTRFFSRVNGSSGVWVDGSTNTDRQGGFLVNNIAPAGGMGTGTQWSAYFMG